jgi:hypothetical protein
MRPKCLQGENYFTVLLALSREKHSDFGYAPRHLALASGRLDANLTAM